MPTRRSLLAGGATGLGAAALGAPSVAGSAAPASIGPGRSRPGPPKPKQISERDFALPEGVTPAERSAGYDERFPHLFEGLKPRYATGLIRSRFIRMRDGTRLATDFHVPLGAKGPLPVVLGRTPYGKSKGSKALRAVFAEQGFIFAMQDVRGRYESEGEFDANAGVDREDGYDTVSWLAAQPWCNGRIGVWGSSYLGETAAKLAAMRHPAHKASLIMFDGAYAGGRYRSGAFLQDGVMMLRELFGWFRDAVPAVSYGPPPHIDREAWFAQPYAQDYATQPVNQPPVDLDAHLRTLPVFDLLDRSGAAPSDFADWMLNAHAPDSAFWRAMRFLTDADRFDTPTLHVTGPQERGGSGFANFELFRRNAVSARARDNQHLIFSPTPHSGYVGGTEHTLWGPRDFGDTRFPYLKTFVDWFSRWLLDESAPREAWPKVRYFVAGANTWRTAPTWPPPDVRKTLLYLRNDGRSPRRGRLSLEAASGEEPPVNYRYDPGDPTPSETPGAGLDNMGSGYGDFAALETRSDVVAYTSEPLPRDLEVAGPVEVVLHVSSSARDTDFAAVLTEVDETGRAINVTHGIARARFREGLDRTVWMEPGGVYPISIDLWFAAIRVARGRRLRLLISSARFPAFDRNLNTGGDNFTETRWVVANNGVHHGPTHPSHLSLALRGGTDASDL